MPCRIATPWLLVLPLGCVLLVGCSAGERPAGDGRAEVEFWHFWGGADRPVVDGIVSRFNASQDRYRVRAVAMPGNNLDLKLFLSIAGGEPPDVVNQDDPIVADWAHRGVLTPLDQLAAPAEVAALDAWLFPVARRLARVDGRYFALPNGLDIRALYYNKTFLDEQGLAPPETTDDLDRIAEVVAPPGGATLDRVGFLPDPKRFWSWAFVFGGRFLNPAEADPLRAVTADSPGNVAALEWMAGYARRYGADRLAAFAVRDQALPDVAFPLLADRRYAAIVDGQWRVRDVEVAQRAARARGDRVDEIGVTPLPAPAGGRRDAGWANGNFFVVPRGAQQGAGAWEFMKFWAGFGGNEPQAAEACSQGGWVPVSPRVVAEPGFQAMLSQRPLMRTFVDLAASKHQRATPPIPVGGFYFREVNSAAQDVVYRGADPRRRLAEVNRRVRDRLAEALAAGPAAAGKEGL